MVVNRNGLNNVGRIPVTRDVPTMNRPAQSQGSFKDILQTKLEGTPELKFSKHAEMRLQMRNIRLTQELKDKINSAVGRAEVKGVKDSLVIVDDLAFVVNVKNRTVITAVNSNELKDNVFTNIDGAVFA